MIMRSKMDRFFIIFTILLVLVTGVLLLFPLFIIDIQEEIVTVYILISLFVIITGLFLWIVLSAKYIFNDAYLLVKGGPFRSRIPYENITKVADTTDILTGYRLLSARDAIEVFYTNAAMGSVKISPENKQQFIKELKKRCPNLEVLR